MRQAMRDAPVGDDVYAEDPTVNALESSIAEALGFETALYGISGTQTNLLGLMAHCERGDEVIVGQQAHTYKWEGGGMAVLGSIQPQPILQQADGTIALADIAAAIKPDDFHYAKTKLIALENTWGGRVLPLAYFSKMKVLADSHSLCTHLDGARLFNAAVAGHEGLSSAQVLANAKVICASFNSVSICLSKGLGAPVGALLLGNGAFIKRARRLRKMIGGGMRQAGILAAGAAYALNFNIERLAQDHANATRLAAGLSAIAGADLQASANTNIVFVSLDSAHTEALIAHLKANYVLCTGREAGGYGGKGLLRMVTHLDVSTAQIDQAIAIVAQYFAMKS